jgi:hypothetical protein
MGSLDFVCLASSRKLSGKCVAGITMSGEWIRPVSSEPGGALYTQDYILNDGSEPAPLDVIRIDASRAPQPHQPENWLISGKQWQRLRRLNRQEAKPRLQRAATPGPYLLGGPSDRISHEDLVEHPVQSSLCLVEPAELRWRITTNMRGSRQVRAMFSLAGAEYDLSVSDPAWENRLGALEIGTYDNAEAGIAASQSTFLTVSLTEPFNSNCFKLVAAVIVL